MMRMTEMKNVLDGELFYDLKNDRFYRRTPAKDNSVPDLHHTLAAEEARTPGKFVFFNAETKVVV